MRKKRLTESGANTFSRASLFGPPPLLEGEDAAAYDELLTRVSDTVSPTDFIEEIWVRDLTDVAWIIFRLRRIQAAYLSAKVWDDANNKASSLAEAKADLLEGTEKIEMEKLLDPDSKLSWETLMAQNPRANKKYQELWTSAKATLNMNEIQAKVMVFNLDKIERIEHLIVIEQQRFDAVIRELDRHRVTQKLRESDQGVEEAEFKIVKPKTTVRKISKAA